MGRRRKFGRPLHGVVVIDKPAGMTSNDVVQKAKRLFFANKTGHTGALDPLATGVLPLCFGEATKFSQYLLDSDKAYKSTFCFGVSTDTADADGQTLSTTDASALTADRVRQAMTAYLGDIDQVPPMYSALKKDGQPLYKLAREGIEVEREARPVTILEYELLAFRPGVVAEADVYIACTKGTYVRTLAEDLGRDLQVGAHVAKLRRVQAGPFSESQALDLEALELERGEDRAEALDHHLLPVDAPVEALPRLDLDEHSAFYFSRGQAVINNQVYRLGDEGDTVRVFDANEQFLGVAEITDDGRVAPKRLVQYG
ncbi:tRNA pseudouridine(55) synthase TruB [Teredinibacter turnerae]|uniref:tRNA pseudouridine synthase B n=1 Tax=Teredinibacter turnerae (strain ATCC 39867 / T7901) TaxID=377629 RepID=C5BPV7_TERTT|nr:tRNA pseudouridine(55) synthase TruB [Teredinibacter turnerae]ACR12800.1 tRNA pseudouridine synthase B [Teredinibacter turnerae T7901]